MKLSRLLLTGIAAIVVGALPMQATAAPVAITFDSMGIFHDPGGAEPVDFDLALGPPDTTAFLPLHTDFDTVDGDSFSSAAGLIHATFSPFFFGFTLASGTGLNQFDPDGDLDVPSSTLTITFSADYLFDAGGFGPWVEFAVIPLVTFALPGDVVKFHLDATFTDVTGAPVVLGPGLLIDFTAPTTGLAFTTLSDFSGLLAPIAPFSTVNIAGTIVFTVNDPPFTFASIFTTDQAGLNIPEPAPILFVLAGLFLLVIVREGARRRVRD